MFPENCALPDRSAIDAVIKQIGAYAGEPIVKGEHPLWLAVVRLEKQCRHIPDSNVQPYRLHIPAHRIWCSLLLHSRAGSTQDALYYAWELCAELNRWIGWLKVTHEHFDDDDCTCPESCNLNCKGECGCEECRCWYSEFLSGQDE